MSRNTIEEFDCCLCGKHIVGYGNNPWPAFKGADSYCCDDCNLKIVIPARIKEIKREENK